MGLGLSSLCSDSVSVRFYKTEWVSVTLCRGLRDVEVVALGLSGWEIESFVECCGPLRNKREIW